MLIALWMAGVLGSALACRERWPNQRELSRKIVHIGTGPVLPLAWVLHVPASIAVPCAVVVIVRNFKMALDSSWRTRSRDTLI